MKRVLSIVMVIVALVGMAQESQSIKLQFDQSKISPQFTTPELPGTIMPMTNIKPTFNANLPTAADLKLDYRSRLSDSLAIYQQQWRTARPALPRFSYDTSPYSHDWSSGGVITRMGGGYLTGASSHTTYPGMGNMASASIAFTMPMGDRFLLTAGLTGSKYHFDRAAWNDYGVFGNASFRLNDRLSLNAFGQYYVNQQFHSVASMPFLGSSSYGGTLGWKASDSFSLDVGALLDGLLNGGKNSKNWGDPKYRPVTAPDAVRNQPGFNPNSPVPIPDAFRH